MLISQETGRRPRRKSAAKRTVDQRGFRSEDNIVRLFDVLPTVDRMYDGAAARVIDFEPLPAETAPAAIPEPKRPARWKRYDVALLVGILVGGLLATAIRFVDVQLDRPDAWIAVTVLKTEGAVPAPEPPRSTHEELLLGCVQGATRGALTAALPAAELATTGVLSSVSAIVVATATGLGCVIGATSHSVADATQWAMRNAPASVQRWFGWQAAPS